MEKVWAAVFCILTITEYVSIYKVVFGKSVQISTKKCIGLSISIIALLGACIAWQGWLFDFRRILLFLACVFVLFSLFPLSFGENLKQFFSSFAALLLIEGILDCMILLFFDLEDIIEMNAYVLGVLLLLWGYYFLRKRACNFFVVSARFKVVAAVMVYLLALMMNIAGWFLIESSFAYGAGMKFFGVFIILGSIASCILLFALIYYFNGTRKYARQAEILERQNEQQREYFEQLLKKEQDTRQFRHDLVAELLELKSYSENGEYGKLDDYLTEMLGEISGISKRQYDVGNDIVNTIINFYFLPIRETCKVKVKGYMYEEQKISQRDLCIVVSNLVKNAVEATEKVQTGQGEIVFEVQQGEKALNIHVENTLEGEVVFRNGLPVSTKTDKRNHGIGLWNVKTVVEKYMGCYNCKAINCRYIVDVFI
jgi:hypothetical protein